MSIRKSLAAVSTVAAAFSLAACQPASPAELENAITGLVTRAQTKCPVAQDATLLRQIFADATPAAIEKLGRRRITVCLNPGDAPMTALPTLSINYNSLGSKTFQLPTEIARDIRAPLLDRVADAGNITPLEWARSVFENSGGSRRQDPAVQQRLAAETAALRGVTADTIILQQIFQPKH